MMNPTNTFRFVFVATIVAVLAVIVTGFIPSVSSALAVSTSTLATTQQSTPNSVESTSTQSIEDQIAAIREEASNNQNQVLSAQADSKSNFASLIIQWSGFFLMAFTVLIALGGFFGYREVKSIRANNHEAEILKEELKGLLKSVEQTKNTIENKLTVLANKFEQDSEILIEASYNFSEAVAAYKKSDHRRALEYFKRILIIQPLNSKVYCRIGRVYTNLGQLSSAIENFDKALELGSDNSEALRGLSSCYRYIEPGKAIKYAQQAIEEDTEDYKSLNYLGLLYRDNSQFKEAIMKHEQARNIKNRPVTDFFLSLLYAHEGDLEKAKLHILSANLALRNDESLDNISSLWVNLIKWGKYIFENDFESAWNTAKDISIFTTTPRMQKDALLHIVFLLSSLGKEELIQSYEDNFNIGLEA